MGLQMHQNHTSSSLESLQSPFLGYRDVNEGIMKSILALKPLRAGFKKQMKGQLAHSPISSNPNSKNNTVPREATDETA